MQGYCKLKYEAALSSLVLTRLRCINHVHSDSLQMVEYGLVWADGVDVVRRRREA